MFPIAYKELEDLRTRKQNLSSYFTVFIEWKRKHQLSKGETLTFFRLIFAVIYITFLKIYFWGIPFRQRGLVDVVEL